MGRLFAYFIVLLLSINLATLPVSAVINKIIRFDDNLEWFGAIIYTGREYNPSRDHDEILMRIQEDFTMQMFDINHDEDLASIVLSFNNGSIVQGLVTLDEWGSVFVYGDWPYWESYLTAIYSPNQVITDDCNLYVSWIISLEREVRTQLYSDFMIEEWVYNLEEGIRIYHKIAKERRHDGGLKEISSVEIFTQTSSQCEPVRPTAEVVNTTLDNALDVDDLLGLNDSLLGPAELQPNLPFQGLSYVLIMGLLSFPAYASFRYYISRRIPWLNHKY